MPVLRNMSCHGFYKFEITFLDSSLFISLKQECRYKQPQRKFELLCIVVHSFYHQLLKGKLTQ